MTDDKLIITFKRPYRPIEPRGWSSFYVDEVNVIETRNGSGIVARFECGR